MRKESERHFSKVDVQMDKRTSEMMFNIISHEVNANQNHVVINSKLKEIENKKYWRICREIISSSIAGGNVKMGHMLRV